MNQDEFEDLLNRYCNGTLPQEKVQELEDLLLQDESKRSFYNSFMNLDASLKDEAEGILENDNFTFHPPRKISKNSFWVAAAIILSLNLFFLYQVQKFNQKLPTKNEPLQTGVAHISHTFGVPNTDRKILSGQQIENEILEFKEGIIQIEMFSGAALIVHGPAKLEMVNSMQVNLIKGKIRCKVPNHAKGFSIITNELKLIDLGTEFTVISDDKDGCSLFVHEGEVEITEKSTDKTIMKVKSQQGFNWRENKLTSHSLNSNEITFQELAEMHLVKAQNNFKEWEEFANSIRKRNDVVLFYSFSTENQPSQKILNESLNNDPNLHGDIVGAKWTKGRWPQKYALNYATTGDRIRLNIPGTYDAVTFSCWVKIHSFDRWLSSLILTDNFDKNELHWQLSDTGEIILGSRDFGNTFSKPVISQKDLGRWLHVATVFAPNKGKIVHYLNGKEVHRRNVSKSSQAKIGKADIGNWTSASGNSHALRSLNGTLDEFIIFSSALSSSEIKEMYEKGSP